MSQQIDEWLAMSANPMAPVMAAVRDVIGADSRIDEAIKYRAPAFLYDGIMAYFHWNAQKYASLIFPDGSLIPGEHPGLLGDDKQRTMRFFTVEEVDERQQEIQAVVESWISLRSEHGSRR